MWTPASTAATSDGQCVGHARALGHFCEDGHPHAPAGSSRIDAHDELKPPFQSHIQVLANNAWPGGHSVMVRATVVRFLIGFAAMG